MKRNIFQLVLILSIQLVSLAWFSDSAGLKTIRQLDYEGDDDDDNGGGGRPSVTDPLCLLCSNCGLCVTLCSSSPINRPLDYQSMEENLNAFPNRQTQSDLYAPTVTQMLNHEKSYTLHPSDSKVSSWNTTKDACGYSRSDAEELMLSIEKMVINFYTRGAHKMDVRSDGGYGLRMLAGHLITIVSAMDDMNNEEFRLRQYFSSLSETSMRLADVIMELAVENIEDKSTYEGMKMDLQKKRVLHPGSQFFWKSADRIKQHFHEFEEIGKDAEVVYPYLDFHCRVALVDSCDVPFVCKKLYLEDIYSQYMLLHQAMYLKYAEGLGCIQNYPERFEGHEAFLNRVCSKAYLEAEYLESHGFPTRYIDLFSEAVGFCGVAGYPNFARDDWLKEIMSWQSPSDSGCFENHYRGTKLIDAVVSVESTLDNGKMIKEECLVHLNSVSLMALAVNLRRVVDSCPMEFWNKYQPKYWVPA